MSKDRILEGLRVSIMLKNMPKFIASRRSVAALSPAVFLALALTAAPAGAEMGPKNGDTWRPVLPTKRVVRADDPLIVGDVIVGKTAENSVVARDQAIADARKAAFQKLAERNMTPEEFKNFKMPADKDIAALVQDFEIKNEQMSSTQYIGNFTVRFGDGVKKYMTIHPLPVTPPAGTAAAMPASKPETVDSLAGNDTSAAAEGETTPDAAATTTATAGKLPTPVTEQDSDPLAQNILVLPYYEDIAGKTMLWEEDNPWLLMWQGALPKSQAGAAHQFTVPLGDISDVATGASNAVWSGDYKPIEKLRTNYGADEVVLAVANKSGDKLTVDLYTYAHNRLRRRATLTPYAGDVPEEAAYKKAMTDVLQYLQQPGAVALNKTPKVEDISREVANYGRKPASSTTVTTTVITQERAPLVNDAAPQVQLQTRVTSATNAMGTRPALTVEDDMQQPYVAPGAGAPAAYPPPVRSVGMQPVYSNLPASGYGAGASTAATGDAAGNGAGGPTRLDARMQFTDPRRWLDVQRRLAAMNPPVRVDITALNSQSVAFTLSSDSPAPVVRQALQARGIGLGAPVTAASGRPVYDVTLQQ